MIGAAVGEDDVVVHLQDVDGPPVVVLAERLGDRRVLLAREHLEAARRLRRVSPHVRIAPDVRLGRDEVADGRMCLHWNPLRERPEVGVGVDSDHAVAAQRRERRSEPDRGRRLPDAALQGQERNSIVPLDRLPDPVEECGVTSLPGRLTQVHRSPGEPVQPAPPSPARRLARSLEERIRNQILIGHLMLTRRRSGGIAHRGAATVVQPGRLRSSQVFAVHCSPGIVQKQLQIRGATLPNRIRPGDAPDRAPHRSLATDTCE